MYSRNGRNGNKDVYSLNVFKQEDVLALKGTVVRCDVEQLALHGPTRGMFGEIVRPTVFENTLGVCVRWQDGNESSFFGPRELWTRVSEIKIGKMGEN